MNGNTNLLRRIATVTVMTMTLGALLAGGAGAASADGSSSLNQLGVSESSSGGISAAIVERAGVRAWVEESHVTHGDTITVHYQADDQMEYTVGVRTTVDVDGEYHHQEETLYFDEYSDGLHTTQQIDTSDLPNEDATVSISVTSSTGIGDVRGGGEVTMDKSGGCDTYVWGICLDWLLRLF